MDHTAYTMQNMRTAYTAPPTHSTATDWWWWNTFSMFHLYRTFSHSLALTHSLIVSQYILRSRCRRPFVRIRIQFCIRLYHLFGIVKMKIIKMKIRCRSIFDDDDDDFSYMRRTGINNCHCRWCRINLYSDIVLQTRRLYYARAHAHWRESLSTDSDSDSPIVFYVVKLRADADIDYVDGDGCHFVLCFVFASIKCYHIATQYPKPFISSNSHYAPNTTAL